ncbi:hypothetical protein NQ315_014692 [Exocentrus adspersus]|uniref:Uncharacterized protein n=1 Tax=Exocentrus adspersus TaxID=1586481 RepID=A0AAV8VQM5_9CUCU|nr:hypothetical protein NQ315_014692 [Exocentrus adspersus]
MPKKRTSMHLVRTFCPAENGMKNWFANVLVHHPYIILSAVAVFSGTCILIPFTLQSMKFPNFQDPEMGFSTRGTTISNRLTAWENLVNSKSVVNMSYSGLTTNPKEYFENQNRSYSSLRSLPSLRLSHRSSKKKIKTKKSKSVPVYGNVYLNDTRNGTETNKDAARWYAIKMLTPSSTEKIFEKSTDTFFCGNPDEKYAHLVVTSSSKTDLFTMSNILAMCRLEYEFSHLKYYEDLCIQSTKYNKCCKPWSLPNYIAMLNNRSSCLAIMEEDVIVTKNILVKCSQFFHNSKVSQDCLKTNSYCGLPIECIRHDTVFDILNFVTSTSFLPPNGTADGTILMETMIFLPLACSSAILPYYHELTKLNLEYGGVRVVAMDFGIKSTLFDEYLIQDAWLMCAGATFVLVPMMRLYSAKYGIFKNKTREVLYSK